MIIKSTCIYFFFWVYIANRTHNKNNVNFLFVNATPMELELDKNTFDGHRWKIPQQQQILSMHRNNSDEYEYCTWVQFKHFASFNIDLK